MVFFTDLNLIEFWVRYLSLFHLFSVIDNFVWLWMGSIGKNTQLMLEFFKVPYYAYTFPTLQLYMNDLLDYFICKINVYSDDTTPYSKCNQASDLWQQLEMAAEHESDLRDTMN